MLAFLGLGSNIGDREEYLRKAKTAIANLETCTVSGISSIYETEPLGNKNQGQFLNQALLVETELEPLKLLMVCKGIEKTLGRKEGPRWGPRTIDIDLLLYDEMIVEEETLRVPHPRLHRRRFVLIPMAEIAPSVRIPGSGKTVMEALKTCPDGGYVTLYEKGK